MKLNGNGGRKEFDQLRKKKLGKNTLKLDQCNISTNVSNLGVSEQKLGEANLQLDKNSVKLGKTQLDSIAKKMA